MQKNELQYDSVVIAEYMLSLAYNKRVVLNVTKVQKLLYIAYGYFLAVEGRHISTEAPKAWPYGPVFPRTRKKVDYSNVLPLEAPKFNEIKKEDKLSLKLEEIIDTYAGYSASQLSDWSHMKGGPWERTTKLKDFKWGITPISDDFITDYFTDLNI